MSKIENKRYYTIYAGNNKGADLTAWMCRLICAFVVRIWHKQVFLRCGSFVILSASFGCIILHISHVVHQDNYSNILGCLNFSDFYSKPN